MSRIENEIERSVFAREANFSVGESYNGNGTVVLKKDNGEKWMLLASRDVIIADQIARQITQETGMVTMLGIPFDRRLSVSMGELVLINTSAKENNAIGIYVHEDNFDRIFSTYFI